jgi:glutaredoxin
MTMSSDLLSARPRCALHGLLLDDARRCARCVQASERSRTRSTLGRLLGLALAVLGVLTLLRVGGAVVGVVRGTEAAQGAPVVAPLRGERLVVYTTSGCRACRMAKTWMADHGVTYEERRVDADEVARRELLALGDGEVVPTFLVDDEVLRGFDPKGIVLTRALKAHGLR